MERLRQNEGSEGKEERLIVEIGSGDRPHLTELVPEHRRELAESGARYVGVDIDEWQLQYGRDFAARTDAHNRLDPHDRVHFVRASADALPFADQAAAEVILANVLGDPEIPLNEKKSALSEAARILKPSGVLKIVEQYTPMQMHEEDLLNYIRAMPEFEQFTPEEEEALPANEKESDRAQTRSYADSALFAGIPAVERFRRR